MHKPTHTPTRIAHTSSSAPLARLGLMFGLTALLAACGGGGGGDSGAGSTSNTSNGTVSQAPQNNTNTPEQTLQNPAPAPARPPAATPPPAGSPPASSPPPSTPPIAASAVLCADPNLRQPVLDAINARRSQGATCRRGSASEVMPAVSAVTWSDLLTSAALRHSQDMSSAGFFSHTGSDGSNAGTRITQAGYSWSAWGENIAAGQPNVDAVVQAWMSSTTGHCQAIMNANFQNIGLACVQLDRNSDPQRFGSYWTLNFARPR
jgi:uncharacterized protein YkwD